MTHWLQLLPGDWLLPCDVDCEGKGRMLVIESIVCERVVDAQKKATTAAVMRFKGEAKKFRAPKTVLFALGHANMFGPAIEAWIGREIHLYSAYCLAFGAVEPCIRPTVPKTVTDAVVAWLDKRHKSAKLWLCKAPKTAAPAQPVALDPELEIAYRGLVERAAGVTGTTGSYMVLRAWEEESAKLGYPQSPNGQTPDQFRAIYSAVAARLDKATPATQAQPEEVR